MYFFGLRTHRRTFTELLEIVDNHERSAAQAAFHNKAIAVLGAQRHVVQMNRIVGADGIDLLLALKFRNRGLWDKNRIVAKLSLRFYPAELARAKYIARIWERRSDANRPGLRVQLPINEDHSTLVGIDLTI